MSPSPPPSSQPSEHGGRRRTLPLGLPSLAAAAVLLAATAGAFVAARQGVAASERSVLRTRVADTARLAEGVAQQVQSAIDLASATAPATPRAFVRVLGPRQVGNPLTNVSLVDLGQRRSLASVGRPASALRGLDAAGWARAARLARAGHVSILRVARVRGSLVVSYVAPVRGAVGRAVYAEVSVRDLLGRYFPDGGRIEAALYLGSTRSPLTLLGANTTRLPLRGAVEVATLEPMTGVRATLVARPGGELVSRAIAFVPWLVLAAGLLLTVGLVTMVETIRRRGDGAVALVRKLAVSERRFRDLFEQANDVMFTLDVAGRVTSINRAGEASLGRNRDELLGTSLADLLASGDADAIARRLAQAANATADDLLALDLRTPGGAVVALEVGMRPIVVDGAVVGFEGIGRDVSERRHAEAELTRRATHDALTGLANRELLFERLEQALAGRDDPWSAPAVLVLDLDDFKTINDSLGHLAGDTLLREVAARISASVGAGDTCARLGGDEFAVLVEPGGGRLFGATEVAARIAESLLEPVVVNQRELVVRGSIGIANAEPGCTPEDLLRNADIAMYDAKGRPGSPRWEVFSPGMLDAVRLRLELTAELKRALEDATLDVRYQPIVDLAGGQITAVEALTRWRRDGEFLAPATFIPIAEETGMILQLGELVLRRACADAARWRASLPDLRVSVNVSGRELQDRAFVGRVARCLGDTGLDADALVLEITETVFLRAAETVPVLAELRELGVRLAIDDFGSGYSSLEYLRRFPVDYLKIDRSFVTGRGLASDVDFLHAIVALADSLDLETVAEGIETHDEYANLRRVRCGGGQGFLFSGPVPSAEIDRIVGGGGACIAA
jgi:diguanylate cyclase (GGDEF)-like protein/PAS domain S-box-containing protein